MPGNHMNVSSDSSKLAKTGPGRKTVQNQFVLRH